MSSVVTLRVKPPVATTIDPTEVSIFYQSNQLGKIDFPLVYARANSYPTVNMSSPLNISNSTTFDAFAMDLLRLERISWRMAAKIKLHIHLPGMTLVVPDLHLDVTSQLNAFNNLASRVALTNVTTSLSTSKRIIVTSTALSVLLEGSHFHVTAHLLCRLV